MYATLILDTETHCTELRTHPTLADAMATIEQAARWMDPIQILRLLGAEANDQWEPLGEMRSYYGADDRISRENQAAAFGHFQRSYRGAGPHHLGERGFTFTGQAQLGAALAGIAG